jgi:hypothetical protein
MRRTGEHLFITALDGDFKSRDAVAPRPRVADDPTDHEFAAIVWQNGVDPLKCQRNRKGLAQRIEAQRNVRGSENTHPAEEEGQYEGRSKSPQAAI